MSTLADLVHHIYTNECSLFLGAGASVLGGGPTGNSLTKDIKRKFKYINEEKDFFKIFDEAVGVDNSHRGEVEKYIKSILASVRPTPSHNYLFSIPWNSVLTTNYDNIPNSVLITLDGNRQIIPIVKPDDEIRFSREDRLYCFKLFGDMSLNYPDKGSMVITNSDRRRAYAIQSRHFNMYKTLAKSENIVYLGYSFTDGLVFEILDDLLYELKGFPHRGFAISPTKPEPEILKKMDKYNIEWIQGTLDDFINEAKKTYGDKPNSYAVKISPFKVHGNTFELTRQTLSNIRGKISFINQNHFDDILSTPKQFFEGKDKTLVPYRENYDFPRKINIHHSSRKDFTLFADNLKSFIKKRASSGNPVDNIKIGLIGTAGSGKSVLASRIAYEWYTQGNPVFYINTDSLFVEPFALESLVDDIWTLHQGAYDPDRSIPSMRYLVICDNAGMLCSQIDGLYNRLMSTGKPVDFLVVDRKSNLTEEELTTRGYHLVTSIDDTIQLKDLTKLSSHLSRLKLDIDTSLLTYNIKNPQINDSFFALMYTTINEARIPLKQIIIDEYDGIPKDLQLIYQYVSLIDSFGLKAYRTIISRISAIAYNAIKRHTNSGKLSGVVTINEQNSTISTNHRVISDIIKEHVFSTKNDVRDGVSRIINASTSGIFEEMRTLHNLLINSIEMDLNFEDSEIEELFELALKKIKTRPLYHHLGKLQLNQQKHKLCEDSLRKAKITHHKAFPEREKNVIDTYGRLELSKSREETDESVKWSLLERASDFFMEAQENPFESPHPYLGLAQTYAEMATVQTDRKLRMNFSINSLKILDDIISNASDGFNLQQSERLQQNIFQNLSKMQFDEEEAKTIWKYTKNANGYAYLAGNYLNQGDSQTAYTTINRGLQLDNRSIWNIRTKIKILKKYFPTKRKEFDDTISLYERIKDRSFDLFLLYELAKLKFKKQQWMVSKELFDELKGYASNYKYRLIPRSGDRWISRTSPKILIGEIQECPQGKHWGQLTSLKPDIPYSILVPRRQINFSPCAKGKRVTFEIVFNMIGPQASNVNE